MLRLEFNRRKTLGILASGVAVAAFDVTPSFAASRMREDIATFVTDPNKLAALKKGVKVMKDRSLVQRDDPKGWYYWAASHGTPDPIPKKLEKIYYHCKHGSPHFLSWHRAFLYFFEQTLREASGDPQFNLPYWNWYSMPSIPVAFTSPADPTLNPLYHDRANNAVAGLSLNPLTHSNFLQPPNPGFSSDLEGNPHGTVHGLIGGDMGDVATSARDPIFWLHHCNIDRLWNVWVNKGNKSPALNDPWSSETFAFDLDGQMKKAAGQLTDTVAMLGYTYDQEASPTNMHANWKIVFASVLAAKPYGLPSPGPVENNVHPAIMAMVSTKNATIASALGSGFSLGTKSSRINFSLSSPNQIRLLSFATTSSAKPELRDVELVLDGIEITSEGKRGGYVFRVCVAVPAGNISQEVLDRQCVGELGSFQISVAQHHMGMSKTGGVTMRFPLGAAIKAVNPKALSENIPVTFVALHAGLTTGGGDKTYLTVKSAHLEFLGNTR